MGKEILNFLKELCWYAILSIFYVSSWYHQEVKTEPPEIVVRRYFILCINKIAEMLNDSDKYLTWIRDFE